MMPAPAHAPDVRRAIHRANLDLDANGKVEAVIVAELALNFYRTMCREQGHGEPAVILGAQ